jgi:hypothetical protein
MKAPRRIGDSQREREGYVGQNFVVVTLVLEGVPFRMGEDFDPFERQN